MDFTNLTAFLDSMPSFGIPGCDLIVRKGRNVVYRHWSGLENVETQRPMTPDRVYICYSTSKISTCAGALALYEKGLFSLTDPLYDFMPEFRDMQVSRALPMGNFEAARPAVRPISVGDLLSMTAGFTYDFSSPSLMALKAEKGNDYTTREFCRAIAKDPLRFDPGDHWNYSLCHDVLGGFIEVVSGMSFGEYLKKNIWEPLGMRETAFRLPPEVDARMATQYSYDGATGVTKPCGNANGHQLGRLYESGGAGVCSTVDDYSLLADALTHMGLGANGERILAPCTVDLMRQNRLGPTQMVDYNWVQEKGYGYGLGVRTMVDRAAGGSLGPVGEFGWSGAAGTHFIADPENEISAFYAQHVLSSLQGKLQPRLRNAIYSAVLG